MANPYVQEPLAEGRIQLRTSAGDIEVELWPKEAPKACRNFVQLCLEGYYDGCIFHRVVPGFIVQTGDPTGTGTGGDCIYDEGVFADELSARLKFTRRGLMAMANLGKRGTNTSQFFFTLDRTDELQGKHTIFGSVIGDTIFNVLKIGEVEVGGPENDRPVYPPTIRSVEVIDNPFDDIVPRVTPEQRKAQRQARKEAKADKEKQKMKTKHQKLAKNKGLLSFADENEVDPSSDTAAPRTKFLSAHDVDTTGRLSAKTAEGRQPITSAAEIPSFVDNLGSGVAAREEANGKSDEPRRVHAALQAAARTGRRELEPIAGASEESEPRKSKKGKGKGKEVEPEMSEGDKVKAEIAKLAADLKASRRGGPGSDSSADEAEARKASKASKTRGSNLLDGAALLAAERAKYLSKSAAAVAKGAGKSSKKRDESNLEDSLAAFRKRLRLTKGKGAASPSAVDGAGEGNKMLGYAGEWDETQDGALGDKDGDDEGWMDHTLRFRKDATVDIHKAEEYSVVDPLADKKWSLDELNARKMNRAAMEYGDRKRDDGRGAPSADKGQDSRRGDDFGGRFGGKREYGGDRREDRRGGGRDDRGGGRGGYGNGSYGAGRR